MNLPKKCLVNKFIPKKTLYEKTSVSASIKEEFVNGIDKITWLYKLSPDTIGIQKDDDIVEIQIFEINLKQKKIPKNVLKIISKSVKYPILFIIKYNSDICYGIRVEESYYTEWNEKIEFEFQGLNLKNVYENIVKKIIHETNNLNNFNVIIESVNRKENLLKNIKRIEMSISREKQFNKKVELNCELQKLKREMEVLVDE